MERDYVSRKYTSRDLERDIRHLKEAKKNLTPERARELLYGTGMYNKDGTLKEEFR